MSPAERSASIAICLPGMLSRLKRAATSAMRPEPLVMTTKFTTTRIVKTIAPMMKLPPMTKLPKAWMTWPAAAVPSCPWLRMRRVEARLSARRSIVDIRSTVGNDENSSGRSMNSATIRMRTEKVIESARLMSSSHGGIGRMRTDRIATTARASAISPRRSVALSRPKSAAPAAGTVVVVARSVMVRAILRRRLA